MGMLEAITLSVIAASTPLLLAAAGELVVERSGVLNLGVEGMMIIGTACGFAAAYLTGSTLVGALAGIIEVAGPIGHLQPGISPGYGFTAIIVAFLGRLNPVGILVAGLFVALTFIGGEGAQISLKVPLDLTKVFQGILLFYVLACDSLILHRIRLAATPGRPAQGHA